ncbi:MAG: globin family protein [Pseudomonadota bacterium]
MQISPEHIGFLRSTWARAVPASTLASELFYGELFRRAPQTKPLFKSDLRAQGAKLMATLAFVVDHLDKPETLLPAARDLAIRHVDYGVTPEHYPAVGAALLWTFEELLGAGFGASEHDAWAKAYAALSEVMIEAAYPETA